MTPRNVTVFLPVATIILIVGVILVGVGSVMLTLSVFDSGAVVAALGAVLQVVGYLASRPLTPN